MKKLKKISVATLMAVMSLPLVFLIAFVFGITTNCYSIHKWEVIAAIFAFLVVAFCIMLLLIKDKSIWRKDWLFGTKIFD